MSLQDASHRVVRAVAREDSDASRALFAVILEARRDWPYALWLAELAALDACTLTVGAWLAAREDWL